MKKSLTLRNFTILFITTLADNSKVINTEGNDKKTAVIPVDYKQRIENVMCADNGWIEMFSPLIDISEYFLDHFSWEQEFAIEIKNILQQMGKRIEYDFINDSINI